ncbi:MAG: hypothetical protein HY014_10585 [Acidobacteria bacterium]|nr:hypothetical protein [Acidobacteriota bacterium]MBI3488600.1 hypothetical protein [Acidobacteriota bacterium]
MNVKIIRNIGLGLGFLAAAHHAQAQEAGPFYGLKLRTAVQASEHKDALKGYYLGFGVEAGYQNDLGRWGAELGLLYKPGGFYGADVSAIGSASAIKVDPARSVDMRKGQVDTLALRLSYEKPWNGVGLRAGLQIGKAKFREEYIGDVTGTDGSYRDAYNGVIEKSALAVSPYVGVSFPVMKDQFLEVQLVGLSYTSATYVHVAGTAAGQGTHNSKDSVSTATRMMPHLELAYAIRF